MSCVLVTFCKRICYWAWSQWLRHWSAELQFEIEPRIPRVFQRLLAQSPTHPSVGRVGENLGNEVAIYPRVPSTTCFAVRMWNRWVLSDAISPTRCLEWGTRQLFKGNVKKKPTTTNAILNGLWSLTFTKKIYLLPHTLSWMRYKAVVWMKCKKTKQKKKRQQQMPSKMDYDL